MSKQITNTASLQPQDVFITIQRSELSPRQAQARLITQVPALKQRTLYDRRETTLDASRYESSIESTVSVQKSSRQGKGSNLAQMHNHLNTFLEERVEGLPEEQEDGKYSLTRLKIKNASLKAHIRELNDQLNDYMARLDSEKLILALEKEKACSTQKQQEEQKKSIEMQLKNSAAVLSTARQELASLRKIYEEKANSMHVLSLKNTLNEIQTVIQELRATNSQTKHVISCLQKQKHFEDETYKLEYEFYQQQLKNDKKRESLRNIEAHIAEGEVRRRELQPMLEKLENTAVELKLTGGQAYLNVRYKLAYQRLLIATKQKAYYERLYQKRKERELASKQLLVASLERCDAEIEQRDKLVRKTQQIIEHISQCDNPQQVLAIADKLEDIFKHPQELSQANVNNKQSANTNLIRQRKKPSYPAASSTTVTVSQKQTIQNQSDISRSSAEAEGAKDDMQGAQRKFNNAGRQIRVAVANLHTAGAAPHLFLLPDEVKSVYAGNVSAQSARDSGKQGSIRKLSVYDVHGRASAMQQHQQIVITNRQRRALSTIASNF